VHEVGGRAIADSIRTVTGSRPYATERASAWLSRAHNVTLDVVGALAVTVGGNDPWRAR
jgi:hypothetical protein